MLKKRLLFNTTERTDTLIGEGSQKLTDVTQ
nr:MAG TPA: hypothetical protein [Caudoviricetes sp.]